MMATSAVIVGLLTTLAGLGPAIHVFRRASQDVDARAMPGQSDEKRRS